MTSQTSFMKIASLQVRPTVMAKYLHFKEHQQTMWCHFLTHQKDMYANVGMLLEILLLFLGGSCQIERGFSTVGRALRENRLSMKNERLNQLLLVVNCLRKHNKNCNQTIITKAVDVYITKNKWHWGIKPKKR